MRAILLFELRRMLRGRTALALAFALGTLLAMCAILSAPYAAQSGLALPGAVALVYHSVLSQFGLIVLGTIYCYAFARDFDGTWRFYAQAGVSPRHAILARLALLSLFSVIAAAAMYLLLSLAFGSAGNASAFAVVSVALSALFCCALSCSVSLVARSPLVATLAVLALFIASSFLNMNLGGVFFRADLNGVSAATMSAQVGTGDATTVPWIDVARWGVPASLGLSTAWLAAAGLLLAASLSHLARRDAAWR